MSVLSPDNMLWWIDCCRRRGKTIVWTNGCFDLLGYHHLYSLSYAAKQGDVLVVGVNSDISVRRLKGEGRPIRGEEERASLVAALSCVDAVTIFETNTPLELVRDIRPDVLVKGEDYRGKIVVGAEYAGRVVFSPLLAGFSTTATLERLRS